MVLFLARIGRAFTSIRTAFTNIRWRNRSQSSAQSSNSSIEVVSQRRETSIEIGKTTVQEFSVGDKGVPVYLKTSEGIYCQAIEEVTGIVLLADLKLVPFGNLAAHFLLEEGEENGSNFFYLMNKSITGYVALTEDNSAFTISTNCKKENCRFEQRNGKINVLGTEFYMMVKDDGEDEQDDKKIIVASKDCATVFQNF